MKIFTLFFVIAFVNISMANPHKPHQPVFSSKTTTLPQAVPLKLTFPIVSVSNGNGIGITTRSEASRLIGLSEYANDGVNFYPYDSITLDYTGFEAEDGNSAYDWDNYPLWSQGQSWQNVNTTSTAYTPDVRETVTYDSAKNITGVIIQYWDTMQAQFRNYEQEFITYNTNERLTKEIIQEWDTTNSTWVNYAEDSAVYSGNNETSYTTLLWNGSSWTGDDQYLYQYDQNNNETAETYQTYSSGWVNNWQDLWTYDVNNNNISFTYQSWSGSAWVNDFGDLYYFNSSNQDTGAIYQNWSGSAWVYNSEDVYTYSGTNQTSDIGQNWSGTSWINNYKYNYTYTGNNQTSEIDQDWDGINLVWDNTNEYLYTWNGSNIETSETDKIWNTGASQWYDSYMYDYDYDGNNNLDSSVDKEDTLNTGTYTNVSRDVYVYNSFNQPTSEISSTWNSGGDEWEATSNDGEYFWYYADYPGGVNRIGNIGVVQLYPNPTADYIHTTIALTQTANLQLRLINVLGQTVWSTNAGTVSYYDNNISVSNLPTGIYMLNVISGTTTETREVVVNR